MSWISNGAGGARIQVRVQPRAARDELVGVTGDHLAVRLTAPPVRGEANKRLQRLLGRFFGCGVNNVTVVKGQTGRLKLVELTGVDEREAVRLLSEKGLLP